MNLSGELGDVQLILEHYKMIEIDNIQDYSTNRVKFKTRLYYWLAKRKLISYRILSITGIISSAIIPVKLNKDFVNSAFVRITNKSVYVLMIFCVGIN